MRAFVCCWLGSKNLGDELIFVNMRKFLTDAGITEITATSKRPAETEKDYGIKAVGINDVVSVFREIAKSDVVVFGGGGLIQDETSILSIPQYFFKLWIAKLLRKPIVCIGLGVGPVRSWVSRRVVRYLFPHSDPVVVRDVDSRDILVGLGHDDVVVDRDLVFTQSPSGSRPRDRLIVALRHFKASGGLVPVAAQAKSYDPVWLREMAQALDSVATQTGLTPTFVSFDASDDDNFHRELASLMSVPTEAIMPDTDNVLAVMGQAKLVVAMRYHAAVTAIAQNIPTVLVTYSNKVRSLKDDYPNITRVIGNSPLEFHKIPDAVSALLALPEDTQDFVYRPRDQHAAMALLRSVVRTG